MLFIPEKIMLYFINTHTAMVILLKETEITKNSALTARIFIAT